MTKHEGYFKKTFESLFGEGNVMKRRFLSAAFGLALMLSFGTAMGGTPINVDVGQVTSLDGFPGAGAGASYGVITDSATTVDWTKTGGAHPAPPNNSSANGIRLANGFTIVGEATVVGNNVVVTSGIINSATANLALDMVNNTINVTGGTNSLSVGGYTYALGNIFTGSITGGGAFNVTSVANTTNLAGIVFLNDTFGTGPQTMNGTIAVNGITVTGAGMTLNTSKAVGVATGDMGGTITLGDTTAVNPGTVIKVTTNNVPTSILDTGSAVAIGMALEGTVTGAVNVHGNIEASSGNATGTGTAGYAEGVTTKDITGTKDFKVGDVTATAGNGATGGDAHAYGIYVRGGVNTTGKMTGGTLTATANTSDAKARSLYVNGLLDTKSEYAAIKATAGATATGAEITGGIGVNGSLTITGSTVVTSNATTVPALAAGVLIGSSDLGTRANVNGAVNTGEISAIITNGTAAGFIANDINAASGGVTATGAYAAKATTGMALGFNANDVKDTVNLKNVSGTVSTGVDYLLIGQNYEAGAIAVNDISAALTAETLSATATTTGSTMGFYAKDIMAAGSVNLTGPISSNTVAGNATGFWIEDALGTVKTQDIIVESKSKNGIIADGNAIGARLHSSQAVNEFGNISAIAKDGTAEGFKTTDTNIDITKNLTIKDITATSTGNSAMAFTAARGIANGAVVTTGDIKTNAKGAVAYGVKVGDAANGTVNGTLNTKGVIVNNTGVSAGGNTFGIYAKTLGATGTIKADGDVAVVGSDTFHVAGVDINSVTAGGKLVTQGVSAINNSATAGALVTAIHLPGANMTSDTLKVNGPVYAKTLGTGVNAEADGIYANSLNGTVADPNGFAINSSIYAESVGGNAHGIHTLANSVYNVAGSGDITAKGGTTGGTSTTAGIYGAGANDTLNFTSTTFDNVITTKNVENYVFKKDSDVTLKNGSAAAGTTKVTTEAGATATLAAADMFAAAQYTNNGQTVLAANQTFTDLVGTGDIATTGFTTKVLNNIDSTYAGTFSGSGDLVKEGTKRLTLTGASDNFSGKTTINAGGITVTNSNGLGVGPVYAAAGTDVTFNFATDQYINNDIHGLGKVIKDGAGTATMTNANGDWTGGFAINNGNVIATRGGATGNGPITIAAASDLTYDIAAGVKDWVNNNITGPGTLTKKGLGTVYHNGNITNVSKFDVKAGEWDGYNSIITNTSAQVYGGATLTASGDNGIDLIGSQLQVDDGATMNVGPMLTLSTDGKVQASTYDADAASTIKVAKGAKLSADSTIEGEYQGVFTTQFTADWLRDSNWSEAELVQYLKNQKFTALAQTDEWFYNDTTKAIDLRARTYDRDTAWENLPAVLAQNGALDFLPLINQNMYDNMLQIDWATYNARVAAGAPANVIAMSSLFLGLNGLNGPMSDPEGYSGYRFATGMDLVGTFESVQDSAKSFTRALGNRAYNTAILQGNSNFVEGATTYGSLAGSDYCVNPYKTRIWAGYTGMWDTAKARGGDRGYKYNENGFNVGLDHLTSSGFGFGAAFGYTKGNYELESKLWDDSKVDNYNFGLYGSYNHASGFFATLLGQYTYSKYDVNSQFSNSMQKLPVPGLNALYNYDHANYKSDTWTIGGALGYDIRPVQNFSLTPSIGLYYYDTKSDTFNSYNGAGSINRTGMRFTREALEMPIDLTARYDVYSCDNNRVAIIANGGYSYNFKNQGTYVEEFWIADSVSKEGGQNGRKPGASTWYAGAGVQASFGAFDIGANYEYVGRYDYHSHNVTANVGIKF